MLCYCIGPSKKLLIEYFPSALGHRQDIFRQISDRFLSEWLVALEILKGIFRTHFPQINWQTAFPIFPSCAPNTFPLVHVDHYDSSLKCCSASGRRHFTGEFPLFLTDKVLAEKHQGFYECIQKIDLLAAELFQDILRRPRFSSRSICSRSSLQRNFVSENLSPAQL